jgi:hypothetical protein
MWAGPAQIVGPVQDPWVGPVSAQQILLFFFRVGPEPARPLGLGQNRPDPSKWLIN